MSSSTTLPKKTLTLLGTSLALLVSVPNSGNAATISWNADNGYWDIATNWSPSLPGELDDVILDVDNYISRTITVRSTGSPFTVNSVNTNGGNEILALTGGILSLTGAGTADNASGLSTVGSFNQSGNSTLTGTGDLVVTGDATINKGSQTGSGTTTFQGYTAINRFLNLDSGRELVNAGHLVMSDYINLNPTDSNGGSGHITNTGIWDVAGDNLTVYATYTAEPDANDMLFNNQGTLRKTAGTGSLPSTIKIAINNTGAIEAQSGTLVLSGGGASTGGNLGASAGAELQFGGGDFTIGGTTALMGEGALAVTKGTVNADVIADFAGTTSVRGGALNLNQDWTTAAFVQTGISTLSGSGNLIVTGNATFGWANQTGTGTTTLEGETTLNDWFYLDSGRKLVNTGHLTMQGSSLINLNPTDNNGGSGSITNTGTWDIAVDRPIEASKTSGEDANGMSFNNEGLLRKTAGTGTASIGVALNNTGAIEVQAGTLSLTNSAQTAFVNNGAITTNTGALFSLNAGSNKTLTNNGLLAGTGTVALQDRNNTLINNGTINAGGENAIGEMTIALGRDGDFQQTVNGIMSFDLADGAYDTLMFDGATSSTVSLTGTLSLNSLFNFTPDIDSVYTLITLDEGRVTGAFDKLLWTGFGPSIAFSLDYTDNSVLLRTSASPVPLPTSGLFLLSGLMLLCRRRARSLTFDK